MHVDGIWDSSALGAWLSTTERVIKREREDKGHGQHLCVLAALSLSLRLLRWTRGPTPGDETKGTQVSERVSRGAVWVWSSIRRIGCHDKDMNMIRLGDGNFGDKGKDEALSCGF